MKTFDSIPQINQYMKLWERIFLKEEGWIVVQTMLCMFLVKVMYIYLVPNS
jgi:hypothetical protein